MSPTKEDRPIEVEEDGSWVTAELLGELLEEGAVVLSVDAQRATGKGDNYLSVLYRTRLEYRTPASEEVRVLNLIVKGLPPGEFIQNYIEEVGVFRREIAMYDDLLPRLYAFADSKLGKDTFKRFSAGFHKTSRPDTLILDDLKPEGFAMAPRRDRLDLAHSRLVVQNLARFHALSIAYDEMYPGTLSKYPDTVFDETNRERLFQFMNPMMTSVLQEVRKWEGFSNIANKMEAAQSTFVTKLMDVCSVANCHRTVLIHGDCWVNNILFKYSEETGQPVDFRFVDYQISREASPALDLHYFLFTSPQTNVRAAEFENLLQEYCDVFERFARELGYKGAPITLDEIRREMDRTAPFGFMAANSILAVVLGDPNDTPDMESITEEDIESGEVELFNKVYATEAFKEAFQNILPYFDERLVFD